MTLINCSENCYTGFFTLMSVQEEADMGGTMVVGRLLTFNSLQCTLELLVFVNPFQSVNGEEECEWTLLFIALLPNP